MFRLRPILIAIACCLTLAVPARAGVMLDGFGPKCLALQETLAEAGAAVHSQRQGGPGIAACAGFQVIAPSGMDAPFTVAIDGHDASVPARLTIAKRAPGIERPPRA